MVFVCFLGHLLYKIHFYMLFEHKCVLAVTSAMFIFKLEHLKAAFK